MVGIIQYRAPELFGIQLGRGKSFRCSESYVKRFLDRTLNWSLRKATRAGQKIPQNAPELLEKALLRMAMIVRDNGVLDQTQTIYSDGFVLTYAERGAKQVSVVGAEEKRAFTLLAGIAGGGEVLPLQAIYQGGTNRSLPRQDSPFYPEAVKLGFRFEPSKTDTYWSTQETMELYVKHILVPYFNKHKQALKRPNQRCIWLIDVWSVHRSVDFRKFMKDNYPWIIVLYVPGGCTGIFQPCDVGIQRVLKHAIQRTAHAHIVQETIERLDEGVEPEQVLLTKKVGDLRDRSVEWIVNGYCAVDRPEIVKKVCCGIEIYSLL